MDRKGIIGIALAIVGIICWQIYYTRETQKAMQARREAIAAAAAAATPPPQTSGQAASGAEQQAPAGDQTAPSVAPPAAPLEAAVPENLTKLATQTVEYSFTNLGGGIARTVLLEHVAEENRNVVLNEFGSIPIGAVTEIPGEGTNLAFTPVASPAPGEIAFERADARGLHLTKRFVLPQFDRLSGKDRLREEYLVRLDLTFANRGSEPLQLPGYFVHTGAASPVHDGDLPIYTGFTWFRGSSNKFIDVNWFSGGGFLFFSKPERPIYAESHVGIRWAGVTNQYFTSLLTPIVDEKASAEVQAKQRGISVWARRITIEDPLWRSAGHQPQLKPGTPRHGVQGAIGMPGLTLAAGQTASQTFTIYAGPREFRRLSAMGEQQGEAMDFGIFGIVSKTLLWGMNSLRGFLGNYAWAIVVLTLIIKTLMWPLQNKATNSMKRMQALQPEMTKLREKYKDDPTRMNTELMKLYKEYQINPVSGCLPMLVQIPIFFGFYNMLGKAVELRNSKFLWVEDLSMPDTIWTIPGIGLPVNPLPLLMAATMFWQMAISPKSGDPIQQRVFMFMPLIFIFFCYNFASALALYWTVQNLFSVVQLYATRDQAPPTLQKVTAPAKKKKRA